MYRHGFQTYVVPEGNIVERFEGAARPGHFRGVATVVVKLLNLVGPDRAYFGRKDAQQAAMVRRAVEDLNIASSIVVCPTARDADGLALSSRNVYLSPADRAAAPGLYRALSAARVALRGGERSAAALRAKLARDLAAIPGGAVDYADLVDPASFAPVEDPIADRLGALPPVLAICAVRFGATRLLDNLRLDEDGS
jgi:pantoate--beta-alanine ligase